MIIGLCGKKFAGKDHLADYLVTHRGFTRVAFGDILKKMASEMFVWMDRDYPTELKEVPVDDVRNVNNLSPRQVWEFMNTLRTVDSEVFVAPLLGLIEQYLANKFICDVVITDIRQQNEFDQIDAIGTTIRIDCDRSNIDTVEQPHIEGGIDSFEVDYDFFNTKDGLLDWIEFLETEVEDF